MLEEPGESAVAADANMRPLPRCAFDHPCTLKLQNQTATIACAIVVLTQEGCRIRLNGPCSLRLGDPVEVSFNLRSLGFTLSGKLHESDGRQLCRIVFSQVIPRRMLDCDELINEISALATATRPIATEMDAQPPLALVPTQPESSLSLRNTTSNANMIAAELFAHSGDAERTHAAEEAGRSRRTNPRHAVDEFAMLFLINVGSKLQGRILDLSLTGCRIRTEERFPVGIYTRIEAEFHLEGLPFRLGGVIQTIHDRHTVGIRFLDMSVRKREQITDLITEIEAFHAARVEAFTPEI